MRTGVDFEQVQGLVRFGYRSLTECSFLLLTIRDAQAARNWLRDAPVSNAVARDAAPATALHVALTPDGLLRLGVTPEILSQFSLEFQSGLAGDPARSRLLGDVGTSAPEHWAWGTQPASLHVLLMLYAKPGKLDTWRAQLQTPLWFSAFDVAHELTTSDLGGFEPFGFPDGLSQPTPDWEGKRTPPTIEDGYTNLIAPGEFLLGYPNEYDRYTDRPLLPEGALNAGCLPLAAEQTGLRDLGRNGCYLVLRTLEQDVTGFSAYVADHAGPQLGAQDLLASAMVGRHRDGTALATRTTDAIPGVAASDVLNQFTFERDPGGTRCPFGAHIRRANPRNGDMPAPQVSGLKRALALVGLGDRTLQSDAKASSRFHRILRRGREYGVPPALAPSVPEATATGPCGIHFICLAANLARQFEFLQSAWIMSTKFDAMTDESDPLLGSRQPLPGIPSTGTFSIQRAAGPSEKLSGLPRFVNVRGGAYFFLPSLSAIRYLASLGPS